MAIDYSFHAILTKGFSYDVVEEIGQAIREGIPTHKVMMTYGYMSDDGQLWGMMSEVAEHGGMSVVHAEDDAIARWLTGKYIREGKTHGAYICEVRGPLVEEAAIRRAMFLAERSGSPLYVLHMAAGSGVEALAERTREGPSVLRRDAERVPQLDAGGHLGRLAHRGQRHDLQRAGAAL